MPAKFARAAALLAAALAVSAVAFATADDKKDPKKDAGVAEVYKGKDGWRFRIKGTDGKSIATSPKGYGDKEDALKMLDTIKDILTNTKPVEVPEK